jgi:hypothetical protein
MTYTPPRGENIWLKTLSHRSAVASYGYEFFYVCLGDVCVLLCTNVKSYGIFGMCSITLCCFSLIGVPVRGANLKSFFVCAHLHINKSSLFIYHLSHLHRFPHWLTFQTQTQHLNWKHFDFTAFLQKTFLHLHHLSFCNESPSNGWPGRMVEFDWTLSFILHLWL